MIEKVTTELEIIRTLKFKDLDEFAKYYYEITKIEKYVKKVKDAIKKQGSNMIFNDPNDIKRLDYPEFSVVKVNNSESVDYKPKNVLEVFSEIIGEDLAWTLLNSSNVKVNQMLKSLIMSGGITADQVDRLKAHSQKKVRKGFLQLKEVKKLIP